MSGAFGHFVGREKDADPRPTRYKRLIAGDA